MSESSFGTVGEAGGRMTVSAVSIGADVDSGDGAGKRFSDEECSEEGCVDGESEGIPVGLLLGKTESVAEGEAEGLLEG